MIEHAKKPNQAVADAASDKLITSERRQYPRVKTTIKASMVWLREKAAPLVWSGRMVNLSRAGAMIMTDRFVAPSNQLILTFNHKDQHLEVKVEVIHSALMGSIKEVRMGVKFISVKHVNGTRPGISPHSPSR